MINFERLITEKNGELRDMPVFEKYESAITKTEVHCACSANSVDWTF